MFSNSSLCNDKDAMFRWISENVFKFFFMQWQGCNVKMNKWECFQILLYAMTRMQMNKWECFQILLCNDKDAMLRWISENVFKFFFMQWQGCNVKMNKWECFQILLYAMTRMQCLDE